MQGSWIICFEGTIILWKFLFFTLEDLRSKDKILWIVKTVTTVQTFPRK